MPSVFPHSFPSSCLLNPMFLWHEHFQGVCSTFILLFKTQTFFFFFGSNNIRAAGKDALVFLLWSHPVCACWNPSGLSLCGLEPSGLWWMSTVLSVAPTWAPSCELRVEPPLSWSSGSLQFLSFSTPMPVERSAGHSGYAPWLTGGGYSLSEAAVGLSQWFSYLLLFYLLGPCVGEVFQTQEFVGCLQLHWILHQETGK